MGKPLLTDEMIERARRGEDISDPKMVDAEETKIIRAPHCLDHCYLASIRSSKGEK